MLNHVVNICFILLTIFSSPSILNDNLFCVSPVKLIDILSNSSFVKHLLILGLMVILGGYFVKK